MHLITSLLSISITAFLGLSSVSSTAQEQSRDFPNKPLRIVVPQGTGGGTDLELRGLQPTMSKYFGQQIIVDNRAGGGGIIGADFVARAPKDGYTLLYAASSFAIVAAASKSLSFDPLNSFTYVSELAERANVVVVSSVAPFATGQEYINYARANPLKVYVGTSGLAQSIHMGFAIMHSMTGTKVTYVHYKEGSTRNADLVSGRIHASLGGLVGMKPLLKTGKVRAIGVTTQRRIKSLPDVPTIAEAGVPGYEFRYWTGFLGPSEIPQRVVERLWATISNVAKDPALIKKMEDDGGEFVVSAPGAFKKLVREEISLFKKIIAENAITLE